MRFALLAAASLLLAGCHVGFEETGPTEHYVKTIELDKSELARVEVKMGAGELKVEGGSPKLLDADFAYNISSWKPLVRYNASSFRGELLIEQPSGSHTAGNVEYTWNLRFNDKLPVDFVTHLGAGEAHMNLGSMSLRSVEVHMGVGQLELDLRGKPTRDYNVEIHGGVGQAIVHLPSNAGIDAYAKGGIGDIDVRGLEKHGDRWVRASRDHSPTIHLDVKGGIGNITLSAE
jgi:hypothetical protein